MKTRKQIDQEHRDRGNIIMLKKKANEHASEKAYRHEEWVSEVTLLVDLYKNLALRADKLIRMWHKTLMEDGLVVRDAMYSGIITPQEYIEQCADLFFDFGEDLVSQDVSSSIPRQVFVNTLMVIRNKQDIIVSPPAVLTEEQTTQLCISDVAEVEKLYDYILSVYMRP